MLTFDTSVTVYNKHTVGPDVKWKRTILPIVSWYGGQGISVSGTDLIASDHYVVRVREKDMPSSYLPELDFRAQPSPSGWSFQDGDIVVRGEVPDEVNDGKITVITAKYKGKCFTITRVHDNRRGPGSMRHIKIEGK